VTDAAAAAGATPNGAVPNGTTPDGVAPDGDVPAAAREAVARLRRWGGDALLRSIAALYAEGVAERTAAIRAAIAAGDAFAVVRAAHALKATCGQVGAVEAESLCRVLESSDVSVADARSLASIAPLAERLEAACEAHVAWLARELETPARS
jgi:HPt (histidine-containing phosphotransfer) domain-containing protein